MKPMLHNFITADAKTQLLTLTVMQVKTIVCNVSKAKKSAVT